MNKTIRLTSSQDIRQLRKLAAKGMTRTAAAHMLGLNTSTALHWSRKLGIQFAPKTNKRGIRRVTVPQGMIEAAVARLRHTMHQVSPDRWRRG